MKSKNAKSKPINAKYNSDNSKYKYLTPRQLKVIDDLFGGKYSEVEVMKKHKISKNIFNKWASDSLFIKELEFRVESSRRQSEMIIARYAPAAAAKLVALTESDKEETARKACLDIITQPFEGKDRIGDDEMESPVHTDNMTQQTATRLLEALAKI